MWTKLKADNEPQLERWLAIVREINPCFALLSISDLQKSIRQRQGQVWFYAGTRCEIATRVEFDEDLNRYRLVNIAIVGRTTPRKALELACSWMSQLLADERIPSIIASRHKQIANQRMSHFYEQAARDPRLQVTVLEENDKAWLWEIACTPSPESTQS